MDYSKLLCGITDCACGREHLCPIDHVEIGSGAVQKLPELTKAYASVVLVADENTWRVQGETVKDILGEKVENVLIYPDNGHVVVPDEASIALLEEKVTAKTDLIIGIGSGVINDLSKYVSFQKNLPYYIVATAPSMDGYASNGAAMILGGMKISPNARPPKAIIADTQVLKDAPMDMIRAGYGDIMGKLSCLNDWKLAALINGEYFCQYVYDLTMDTVEGLRPLAEKLLARDGASVGLLMEALVTVGIAMSFVGNSRPASGSEHHLSHFFEITGLVHGRDYYPHGIDVAYSAVATAKIRRYILDNVPAKQLHDEAKWEEVIHNIYGSVADGCIALQKKLDSYRMFSENTEKCDWNAIRACLQEAPDAAEMEKIISDIGLDYAEFCKFYGMDVIEDAAMYAKDLKDRYTVLWLFAQFFTGEGVKLS